MKTITKEQILCNPAASNTLKAAVRAFDRRDPCDAIRDAEMLVLAMKDKFDRVVHGEY